VDLAKKRRGGSSRKRPSYYLVERTVVFSECTLPVRPSRFSLPLHNWETTKNNQSSIDRRAAHTLKGAASSPAFPFD
jgi:hypothetical protein